MVEKDVERPRPTLGVSDASRFLVALPGTEAAGVARSSQS